MLDIKQVELPANLLIVSEDKVLVPSDGIQRTKEDLKYLEASRQIRFGTVIHQGALDNNTHSRHPSLKGEKNIVGRKIMYLSVHKNIDMDIEVSVNGEKVPTPIMLDANYITAFIIE